MFSCDVIIFLNYKLAIQAFARDYKRLLGLLGYKGDYKGLQGIKRGYKGLLGSTRGYKGCRGLQKETRVTVDYKGLQWITRV